MWIRLNRDKSIEGYDLKGARRHRTQEAPGGVDGGFYYPQVAGCIVLLLKLLMLTMIYIRRKHGLANAIDFIFPIYYFTINSP